MAAKKRKPRTRKPEPATVKEHARQVWAIFVWIRSNPWVFGILVAFWGSIATGGLTLGVKMLAPFVRPIADKEIETAAA